ncbi:glutamate--cysteine ligase [Conglomerata obtusa]
MGLLRSNDCLQWKDIVRMKEQLKRRGVLQFVHVYRNAHSTFVHEFIWGDEIEVMACAQQNDVMNDTNVSENDDQLVISNDGKLNEGIYEELHKENTVKITEGIDDKLYDNSYKASSKIDIGSNEQQTSNRVILGKLKGTDEENSKKNEKIDGSLPEKERVNQIINSIENETFKSDDSIYKKDFKEEIDKELRTENMEMIDKNKLNDISINGNEKKFIKSSIQNALKPENTQKESNHPEYDHSDKKDANNNYIAHELGNEDDLGKVKKLKDEATKQTETSNNPTNTFGSKQDKNSFKNNKSIDNAETNIKQEANLINTLTRPSKLKNRLLLCSELIIPNFKHPSVLLTVEFASYMIETTPSVPHSSKFTDLKCVEECMKQRLRVIKSEINRIVPNSYPLLITCFPKIGKYDSFYVNERSKKLNYEVTRSMYFPDNAITDHKRFYSFVRNIINRRGRKVEGYIKIMALDKDTKIKEKVDEEINSGIENESENIHNKEVSTMCDNAIENVSLCTESKKVLAEINKSKAIMIKEGLLEDDNIDNNSSAISNHTQDKNNKSCEINQNNKNKINIYDVTKKDESNLDDNNFKNISNADSKTSKNHNNSKDDNTIDNNFEEMLKNDKKVLPGYIRIDSMGQGMGCCCLQLTIQASYMSEARMLYDMLGSLCPLFLRLTRATPISQGFLLATETRWDMLEFSVDCRTDTERGCSYTLSGSDTSNTINDINNSANSNYSNNNNSNNSNSNNNNNNNISSNNKTCLIKKSRFSSIDMYISEDERNLKMYNDLHVCLHKNSYNILKKNGVDDRMARHVASLFIRDPILVYKTDDMINDTKNSIITENDSSKKRKVDNNNLSSDTNNKITNSETNNSISNDVTEDGIINVTNDNISHANNVFKKNGTNNNNNVNDVTNNNNDVTNGSVESVSNKNYSYDEIVKNNEKFYTDDFENIQSSNWRSMRFKLPTQNGNLQESGWKVEVRPMEIQPTAFENSAYTIFVVLLSKAIISYKINFYLPLSLVDENFRRANLLCYSEGEYRKRLGKDRGLFYYRKNIFNSGEAEIGEGTIEEIFMGSNYKENKNIENKYNENKSTESTENKNIENNENKNIENKYNENKSTENTSNENQSTESTENKKNEKNNIESTNNYEGIFNIVKRFVDENCEENEKEDIKRYLNFIKERITGNLMSVSDFMRKFVITHEEYKNDAVASENILDELIDTIKKVTEENSIEYLRNI